MSSWKDKYEYDTSDLAHDNSSIGISNEELLRSYLENEGYTFVYDTDGNLIGLKRENSIVPATIAEIESIKVTTSNGILEDDYSYKIDYDPEKGYVIKRDYSNIFDFLGETTLIALKTKDYGINPENEDLDRKEISITSNSELIDFILSEKNKDLESKGYQLEIVHNSDGSFNFVRVYNDSTISAEEYQLLLDTYDGKADIDYSLFNTEDSSITFSTNDWLERYGFDASTDIETALKIVNEKYGINYKISNDDNQIILNNSIVNNKISSYLSTFINFSNELDMPGYYSSIVEIDGEQYRKLYCSEDDMEKFFYNAGMPLGERDIADYFKDYGYNGENIVECIDNLTEKQRVELANKGIFVVDTEYGRICLNGFYNDKMKVTNVGGNYEVLYPYNSDNQLGYDSNDVYAYLTDYCGYSDINENNASYQCAKKYYTQMLNENVSTIINSKYGIYGINILPANYNENMEFQKIYVDNTLDYNNSCFIVNYGGFTIPLQLPEKNSDEPIPAKENIDKILLDNITADNQSTNSLGLIMSILIDSDNEYFTDGKTDEEGNLYKVEANLKSKGFSKITKFEDGSYKIYLSNGQYYMLGDNDVNVQYNEDTPYSISQIVNNVNSSEAMQNLNIQNKLSQTVLADSNVDVRTTDDIYSIYIDGEIFTVKKKDINNYAKNYNLDLNNNDVLTAAIYKVIENSDDFKNRKKTDNYNNFIPTSMFIPYIDVKNEEYYREVCSHLIQFNDELMEHSRKIETINIDSKFINSIQEKNAYKNDVVEVADECIKLSKKIEYCINLITQCDISLKTVLEDAIGEFFDSSFELDVSRSDTGNINVSNEEMVTFFENKMDEYKEQIPYYDMLIKGMIEIPSDLISDFKKSDLECKNGKYFASYKAISSYISKKENTLLSEGNTIYDWISQNFSDNMDMTDPYNQLKKNISISKIALSDVSGTVRLRDNIDAFCNTKPYLNDIFTNDYYTILENVRNGNYGDKFSILDYDMKFPPYLTDFQKTLMIYSTSHDMKYFIDKKTEISKQYNNQTAINQSVEQIINLRWQEYSNNLKKIVPYSYNQIEGYNKAIEAITKWYEDGNGIDFGDESEYYWNKFWTGVGDYPANMIHIFEPDTTSTEYKYKYMAEILSSISSYSEKEIVEMANSGKINEKDKELRLLMANTGAGNTPGQVAENGEISKTVGTIASEITLYAANAQYLKTIGLASLVKGASMAGKTTNKAYMNGYSAEVSILAGLVSGAVTGTLMSNYTKKFQQNYFTLTSKDGSVSYNVLQGKFKFNMATKERLVKIANENLPNIASYEKIASLGAASNQVTKFTLENSDDAIKFLAGIGVDTKKIGINSALTAINPISQLAYAGTYNYLSYGAANAVLWTDNIIEGEERDYISNENPLVVLNTLADIVDGEFELNDIALSMIKEGSKSYAGSR